MLHSGQIQGTIWHVTKFSVIGANLNGKFGRPSHQAQLVTKWTVNLVYHQIKLNSGSIDWRNLDTSLNSVKEVPN
jgi:hypothetical protein